MEIDKRTFAEKVSDAVAKFGGSWYFIISGISTIIIWVFLNLFFKALQWDAYPFILLNLFLSLIASFQAPFILMTQKRCEIKQDAIYRSLFREIKDLVEASLSLEHEMLEKHRELEQNISDLQKELKELRSFVKEKPFSEGDIYEV